MTHNTVCFYCTQLVSTLEKKLWKECGKKIVERMWKKNCGKNAYLKRF